MKFGNFENIEEKILLLKNAEKLFYIDENNLIREIFQWVYDPKKDYVLELEANGDITGHHYEVFDKEVDASNARVECDGFKIFKFGDTEHYYTPEYERNCIKCCFFNEKECTASKSSKLKAYEICKQENIHWREMK